MNAAEWDRHKATWCHRCFHDHGRRNCALRMRLDEDPDDYMAMAPFRRLGKCSQFKEFQPKKRKDKKVVKKRGGRR